MARPPMLSYEGALRVLGKYDHPWLDKTDVFLGVSILVGGAVEPGVLSLVDPKNEATASFRKFLDWIAAKSTGLTGVHRHELIAAAHTIIAVSSVFDAFRDEIGPGFDALDVTDCEKFRVLGTEPGGKKEITALPSLTALNVPAPNATRGFQENLDGDLGRFFTTADLVTEFIAGLVARPSRFDDAQLRHTVAVTSREKYKHHFLGLAAAIPEFSMWMLLNGQAAASERGDARLKEALTTVRAESLEIFRQLLLQVSSGQVPPESVVPSRLYRGNSKRRLPPSWTNRCCGAAATPPRSTRSSRPLNAVSWPPAIGWPSTTRRCNPRRRNGGGVTPRFGTTSTPSSRPTSPDTTAPPSRCWYWGTPARASRC